MPNLDASWCGEREYWHIEKWPGARFCGKSLPVNSISWWKWKRNSGGRSWRGGGYTVMMRSGNMGKEGKLSRRKRGNLFVEKGVTAICNGAFDKRNGRFCHPKVTVNLCWLQEKISILMWSEMLHNEYSREAWKLSDIHLFTAKLREEMKLSR